MSCWCVVMIIYRMQPGGLIIKDFRKFLGSNKSPACLMAGSKVPGNELKPGPSFGQIQCVHYIRMYAHCSKL